MTRPEAKSYIGLGEIAGQQVVLAKPQTMMNLSGAVPCGRCSNGMRVRRR